jgi:outer membrane protein assembly factor BamC
LRLSPIRPLRAGRLSAIALAALATLLAACTSTDGLFGGDKVDYRNAAAKSRPLDVPPDLTQLARESRYQAQGGVVSAAAAAAAPSAVPTAAAPALANVAPGKAGDVRIERAGQQRWLVVAQTPEQLWPQLRTFWQQNGFTLAVDNPQIGIMETTWSENRAKLPSDVVRNVIGNLARNVYDTGERDLFRTRVERTEAGTEIYISHRGAAEVYMDNVREITTWRTRPSDPGLEAEFLGRLMLALGGQDEAQRVAQAAAGAASSPAPAAAPRPTLPATAVAAVSSAPEPPPRARIVDAPGGATLEVDESFDRAWRRVGLALDRGGFTVEDRDRAQGVYFVRWVDPRTAGQEEPNFFARVFGGATPAQTPVRYRIVLKGQGPKTTVRVLTSAGEPEPGENGQRIVAQLVGELK